MANEDKKEDEEDIEESYQVGISDELSFSLRVGGSYLIKERKAENGMMIFVRLTKMGMRGLCISGTIPKKIRSKYGLVETDAEILWLSGAGGGGEQSYNPNRIDFEAMDRISEFMKGGGRAIFLDSLEMIEIANGFDKAIEFVKTLSDFAAMHNGIFILSITPMGFKREQLATLEWQLEPLSVESAEGVEVPEKEPTVQPVQETQKKVVPEIDTKLKDADAERIRVEDDNKRLAEGMISLSKDLENAQQIIRLKEEETTELRKQIAEMNTELKKIRIYGQANLLPGDQAIFQINVLEERVKTLEDEKKRLEDILIRRDDEIKHLSLIIKEKDESLTKKQEMLKTLLSKMTDVEVRISSPKKPYPEGEMQASRPQYQPVTRQPPPQFGYRPPPPISPQMQRAGPLPQSQMPISPPAARYQTCPTCGSVLMRVRGIGDTERLFCERCRRWLK